MTLAMQQADAMDKAHVTKIRRPTYKIKPFSVSSAIEGNLSDTKV